MLSITLLCNLDRLTQGLPQESVEIKNAGLKFIGPYFHITYLNCVFFQNPRPSSSGKN